MNASERVLARDDAQARADTWEALAGLCEAFVCGHPMPYALRRAIGWALLPVFHLAERRARHNLQRAEIALARAWEQS